MRQITCSCRPFDPRVGEAGVEGPSRLRGFITAALVATLSSACGHVTHVRPTPKGQLDVQAAAGGPFVKIGPVLPLPLSTVGASYGVHEKVDVHAHVHLTSLAFGVGGLDVGATYLPLAERGWIPAVSLTGRLYGFTDLQSARPYLEVGAAGSYFFGERFLTYLALNTLVQFFGAPPLWSVAVGEEVRLGHFGVALEARWFSPTHNITFNTVEWVGLGGQGALGIVLGLRYRFGGAR
ncbi:MAG: hypothetical protein ACT4TC_20955 [Myxococcaceae bacterium]